MVLSYHCRLGYSYYHLLKFEPSGSENKGITHDAFLQFPPLIWWNLPALGFELVQIDE